MKPNYNVLCGSLNEVACTERATCHLSISNGRRSIEFNENEQCHAKGESALHKAYPLNSIDSHSYSKWITHEKSGKLWRERKSKRAKTEKNELKTQQMEFTFAFDKSCFKLKTTIMMAPILFAAVPFRLVCVDARPQTALASHFCRRFVLFCRFYFVHSVSAHLQWMDFCTHSVHAFASFTHL